MAPLPGALLCCLAGQAHRRASWLGSYTAHQTLKGAPWEQSYSVLQYFSHLNEHPGWGPTQFSVRRLMGQPLYCSAANASMWGDRLWWWLHSLCVTQQLHLASMAACLSSTGNTLHNLLPHIPSICLSAVNSSPHPGSHLNPWISTPSQWTFQGTKIPVLGMYGCTKDYLILIPSRLPQINCFTLKCFSSDLENCHNVEIRPLLHFPLPRTGGPVLLTFLSFPLVASSFIPSWVLVVLYICFHWSGTPVQSQLVFCMHFCVWWCIRDVSLEKDVLHIHLLVYHLVLWQSIYFFLFHVEQ